MLTHHEEAAIRSLERVASKWPGSLKLVSAAGSLVVVFTGMDLGPDGKLTEDKVLATISGIPNDGGDPW